MNTRYEQRARLIALEKNPLGKDVLLLTAFSGKEEISRLFNFELDLLSLRADVKPDEIIGKNITFVLKRGDSDTRYFNGYVNRFSASGLNIRGMRLYRAEVVPWLWFLTQTADCRIFQGGTVPKIIEQVFTDLGFKDFDTGGIKGKHPKWDYCVQYRETNFNFVSRLMEQEGIFYWFQHTAKDKHILMLADHKGAYEDLPEQEVEHISGAAEAMSAGHVWSWEHLYEFLPGRWAQSDYNFTKPSASLQTSTSTVVKLPSAKKYEIYDYPGEYLQRGEGQNLTELRMEEAEATYDTVEAASDCRSFCPGGKFTLKRHECTTESKKCYLVKAINHSASNETYIGSEEEGEEYSNTFSCIPADVVFRPSRITPKPLVQGPQTAVVVGPSGEEIYTDKYGRVKFQFHWDRKGKRDEKSSCWVRVSQPWAGENWGGVIIPRIGLEVIVEFLEGDPDRPIVTGRVYNAEQMPPYSLPGNKTQTGMKSRSSPGGGAANFNEIRFEDKKGQEQLFIHAEKDQAIEVENDENHSVGNNEKITIGNDRTESVGNNETITIGSNRTEQVGVNETVTIGSNRSVTIGSNKTETITINKAETIGAAKELTIGGLYQVSVGAVMNETVALAKTQEVGATKATIVAGNVTENYHSSQTTDVSKNHTESVGKNQSIKVGENQSTSVGKNISIEAGDQIVIKTGKASITMKKDGTITIKGKDISVDGSGKINVKASNNITMKGQKILQN
jgi:type VI secretion system secreted protein VgrG